MKIEKLSPKSLFLNFYMFADAPGLDILILLLELFRIWDLDQPQRSRNPFWEVLKFCLGNLLFGHPRLKQKCNSFDITLVLDVYVPHPSFSSYGSLVTSYQSTDLQASFLWCFRMAPRYGTSWPTLVQGGQINQGETMSFTIWVFFSMKHDHDYHAQQSCLGPPKNKGL